ncbi:hypothetical protein EVAR_32100_1 [Eumeta japonica]|uniref:Uncharacterized protein n=1 Tax=Eumeta variegata TaxID=151549 RepID=A0A4C1V5Q5_EUMVA|nr:hypothetical protein EVAR_32100_1 [Eumeta japonica]
MSILPMASCISLMSAAMLLTVASTLKYLSRNYESKKDDPPDDMDQPPTNVLLSVLVPALLASFVTLSDATTICCSENETSIKKKVIEKSAGKERHRSNSKLNATVSSQPPSLTYVQSLPHHSKVGPTRPSPFPTPSDTTSPSTKSVGRLDCNNNERPICHSLPEDRSFPFCW